MIIINEDQTKILSRFYWQNLLKISSKVQNQRILVFYFISSITNPSPKTIEDALKLPESVIKKEGWKTTIVFEFNSMDQSKKCVLEAKMEYKKYKAKLCMK